MLKALNLHENLHILVVHDKEKGIYLAHCLDMDIVSQGTTSAEAVSSLKELIVTQIEYCLENEMLDTLFRQAPKGYWDMFYRTQAGKMLRRLSLRKSRTIKSLTSHIELAYA